MAALQHGARADDCRRGRQAAEPRARLPGGGTHADCEPDKVHPGPAGDSQLQTVESPGGVSPPGAPRSVREPLDSYGSRCSAVSMAELPVGKERWVYAA